MCLELHKGCRIMCLFPFLSKISAHAPSTMEASEKSSKPMAEVAVLCSPYEGGMPRTHTSMNLLPISFSWSRTVFFLIPEATWCYSLDHWLWSWLCMYWWCIFLFVNCITALPPCLHIKYTQCCSDLWAGHLRGMILPYNMHWDCVTILLEGKTLSDKNFK